FVVWTERDPSRFYCQLRVACAQYSVVVLRRKWQHTCFSIRVAVLLSREWRFRMPRLSCGARKSLPYLNRLLELLYARKMILDKLIRSLEQTRHGPSVDLIQRMVR